MFVDRAEITIRSGNGGNGAVTFRRDPYVPDGGPDGGDGGNGGSVIFIADRNLRTLMDLKYKRKYQAENGQPGMKRNRYGKKGQDLYIKVPVGTMIIDKETGHLMKDLVENGDSVVVAKGGRGGRGNMNFATPTNQAPQYGEPGKPAIELDILMELKMVADVGLVGFPNAGKSTFLKRVTNADPKIADYPFTTINPNLGVVNMEDGRGFVIADMPGLIEGASEGVGLGHEFLRHIERTRVLIHIVDAAPFDEERDPVADIYAINKELEAFNPAIMKKPMLIAANKTDVSGALEVDYVEKIRAEFAPQGYEIFPISAVSGQGVKELLREVMNLLDTTAPEQVYYEQEFFPEDAIAASDLPYTIELAEGRDGGRVFVVEGPKIDKMLSYTNLESEKGFLYFQRFLKTAGIQQALREMGIRDGETVRMYGHEFDYYEDEMNEQ